MKKNLIGNLVIGLILALAIGFFVSRALVSIATLILFCAAVFCLIYRKPDDLRKKKGFAQFLFFTSFYAVIMSISLFAGRLDCFTQPLISYAPLLLLPFSFLIFEEELLTSHRKVNFINWVFIGGVGFLLVNMVFEQGFDSKSTVQAVTNSKNVTNMLGIHHNIVGFLGVFSIIYVAETFRRRKSFLKILILICIIFLIHYLGLRFAIFCFYPVLLIYLIRLGVSLRTKLYTTLIGLMILILSWLFVPAFNARYQNTKADVANIVHSRNPNYWSLNQRFIANEIGFEIAKQNWILGVGSCEIKVAFEEAYKKNSRLLIPENRKFIHNQVVYGWATFGSFYVIAWLALFTFLIYKGIKEQSILLEISLLFLFHQMVENTLEKQLMLMLLVYMVFVMPIGLQGGGESKK